MTNFVTAFAVHVSACVDVLKGSATTDVHVFSTGAKQLHPCSEESQFTIFTFNQTQW